MQSNIIKDTLLAITFLLTVCMTAYAGDFDDGIELDEKIEKYDDLDEPGTNIQYIKRSAKASVSGSSESSEGSGDIAIGGFINKAGAEVGDVTIIFEGEDINAISE